LADIFRLHGPDYRARFQPQMPPSHLRAMEAIENCRTEALGGQVYHCTSCDRFRYSYHSCQNRHCPKCRNDDATTWLARQQQLLLPVPHFLVTFTLPDPLRRLARSHQKVIYNLLFHASAAALQKLARDPRFVGGQLGLVGVLQTWTRDLRYHPHIHYLVPAAGLSADGQQWLPAQHPRFLIPVKALGKIFRAKFRNALRKTPLYSQVAAEIWTQPWIVHCEPAGSGQAVLKYLAPYVFRVALSNHRLLKLQDGQVTFRYRDRETNKQKLATLPAPEFIRRFLQHVLPHRFQKVRCFGFFRSQQRSRLQQLHALLTVTPQAEDPTQLSRQDTRDEPHLQVIRCPQCGCPMQLVEQLPRQKLTACAPRRIRPP
jgi:Putative transposase/Transposase zinc-binding domain